MHFVFLTRGHMDSVEPFIKELSTRYLEFDYPNENKTALEKKLIKMRLCPIQLWDLSFPKQHLDPVLMTCLQGCDGKPMHRSADKFVWGLRKAMKLKPVPEYKKDRWLAMSPPKDTEIIGVGIKEDNWFNENGKEVNEKDRTSLSYEGI